MFKKLSVIFLLLLVATDTFAWRDSRDQRWEAMFELHYMGDDKLAGKQDSYIEFREDFGWGFGFGYNLNKHFNLGVNFGFTDADYKARVFVEDQNNPGAIEEKTIRHKASHYNFHIDATYHLLAGNFTPLLMAGIGSGEVDSNISNGPGYSACWWDPWYGYMCNNYYNSYSASGISTRLGAGLRWDFGNGAFLKAVYTRQYLDLDLSSGDPEFDRLSFQLGSKF